SRQSTATPSGSRTSCRCARHSFATSRETVRRLGRDRPEQGELAIAWDSVVLSGAAIDDQAAEHGGGSLVRRMPADDRSDRGTPCVVALVASGCGNTSMEQQLAIGRVNEALSGSGGAKGVGDRARGVAPHLSTGNTFCRAPEIGLLPTGFEVT